MPHPVLRPKIVKKTKGKFKRFQSDKLHEVHESWRKPRGIDNRVRRRYKGNRPMPTIGYRSNIKTRHLMPDGFLKFRVNNVNELNLLLMHNGKYAAEISAGCSSRTRAAIVARAAQLDVKVVNANARLKKEEKTA